MLDLREKWYLHFWSFAETEMPVETVVPKHLPIEPGLGGGQLWPIPKKRKRVADPMESAWQLYVSNAQAAADTEGGDTEDIPEELLEQWEAAEEEEDEEEMEEEMGDEADGLHPELVETYAGLVESMPDLIAAAASVQTGLEVHAAEELEPVLEDVEASTSATAAAATAAPIPMEELQQSGSLHGQGVSNEQTHHEPASGNVATTSEVVPIPHAFFGRSAATAAVLIGERGKISFYAGKQVFEAVCKRHESCKLTRSCRKSARTNGRPLGLMVSWLLEDVTASDHKEQRYMREILTLAKRRAAREHLQTLADANQICAYERALEPGEDAEPETLKGLM
eukprot:6477934-Amphidinium_carterae.3